MGDVISNFFSKVITEYGVTMLNIAVTIVIAIIVRAILLAIIRKTVKRIIADSTARDERIKRARSAGEKPPKTFPLSPLAVERVAQRTRALASLAKNIVNIVVAVVTLLIVLSEVGVNLTALLASAGIIAAGLAFGAQNLVKDILNGIFMVFEDQIGVGDSVTIGEIDGTVEVVGIRITQVRAFDGTLWFIRNGEILKLGNSSHGWGRAIVDVSVEPETNLAEVKSVLEVVANEVVASEEIRAKVSGAPEVGSGLNHISEDRATVRVTVKTAADEQDTVERAIREAMKTKFDALGIRFAPDKSAFILRQWPTDVSE